MRGLPHTTTYCDLQKDGKADILSYGIDGEETPLLTVHIQEKPDTPGFDAGRSNNYVRGSDEAKKIDEDYSKLLDLFGVRI